MKKACSNRNNFAQQSSKWKCKTHGYQAPEIANLAEPGQFVHVKTLHSENFLRRPFSIADVDKNEGTITLIYRIVGKGTAEIF